MTGAALEPTDPIPLTDLSASETKKITAKDFVQYGIALIDAGSIPGDKVSFAVPPETVGTAEIVDGSITAIKMADGSTGVVQDGPLPNGEYIGQLGLDLLDNQFYVWDGGAWHQVKASGSINDVAGGTAGLITTSVVIAAGTATVSAGHAPTTAARQFLAGPSGSAGAVSARQIVGVDLPAATNADKGAVIAGGGLAVDASGVLSVGNTVAAQTARSLATWDANGLVTGGSPIVGTDLPAATAGSAGAVFPGAGLTVGPGGELQIDNTVTAGTYPKVTVSNKGLVTGASALVPDDIPALDASKINTGELPPQVFPDDFLLPRMVGDYTTALIQESDPGDTDPITLQPHFLGRLWLQPSTNQLRIYARSSDSALWLPVGFGQLQSQNLRFGGTIDAATGGITKVTPYGTSVGYAPGLALNPGDDTESGLYFIVDNPGGNIDVDYVSTENFEEQDWVLCIGSIGGWLRIEGNVSTGGGGGAKVLGELDDVTIADTSIPTSGLIEDYSAPNPRAVLQTNQVLKYDATGYWKNNFLYMNQLGDVDIPTIQDGQGLAWDGTKFIAKDLEGAAPGDGNIIIDGGNGITATGDNATANQEGDTTRTISIDETWLSTWLDTNKAPGDGAIQIEGGDGIVASGDNGTANQEIDTIRTLSVDETWLGTWLDTNKAPGDGKLVFKAEDGSDIAEFTANQDTNLEVDVTIPTQHWTDDGSSLKTSPPDRSVECGIVSLDEAGHRGVQLKATGRIEIQSFASSSDNFVIFEYVRGRQTGGNPTEGVEIQMRANGDAEFHGIIKALGYDLESLPVL